MNNKISALLISICLSMMGCTNRAEYTRPATQLLVLGNSITYHVDDPSLGWSGKWGMAASAENKDFAHLTATALKLPLTRFNIASLETTPSQVTSIIATVIPYVDANTAVILELGDNVSRTPEGTASFQLAYRQLLAAVRLSRSVTCSSTFWHNTSVDTVIQQECFAIGGKYVYIGNLYGSSANPDAAQNTFADKDVAGHPQDWSMKVISQRLVDKINNPY